MSRPLSFSFGEYYHLYSRGVDKRLIFENTDDYNRFLLLLYLCNGTDPVDLGNLLSEGMAFSEILTLEKSSNIVSIGSYVLMPNHFHLLVKEIVEGGISKFMGKVLTGYSMYFNKKRDRSGSLFEGRFKSVHANKDEYLKYLFAYIHLNPVKLIDPNWKENGIVDLARAEAHLRGYRYSSYLDYIGLDRLERKLLSTDSFPEYFNSGVEFDGFVKSWLSYRSFSEGVAFS